MNKEESFEAQRRITEEEYIPTEEEYIPTEEEELYEELYSSSYRYEEEEERKIGSNNNSLLFYLVLATKVGMIAGALYLGFMLVDSSRASVSPVYSSSPTMPTPVVEAEIVESFGLSQEDINLIRGE